MKTQNLKKITQFCRYPFATLAITILVIFVAALAAPVVNTRSEAVSSTAGDSYDRESVIEQLVMDRDIWRDASAHGDTEASDLYMENLFGLIDFDISQSEILVRDLARTAALIPPGEIEEHAADRELFSQSLSLLNCKEALCLAMRKCPDFNYRYRLLGDYINLLRRELKMPKSVLASRQEGTSSGYTLRSGTTSTNKQHPPSF